MRGKLRGKLTYANVMATIAVFIALAGTGYAASKINGSSIKKNSVPGNRIKKNSLGGTQINESKLGKVPLAAQADTATQSNGPLAYARVTVPGGVMAAYSRGVVSDNVSRTGTGRYCIDLPSDPKTAVAIVDGGESDTGNETAQVAVPGSSFFSCPAGADIQVFTSGPSVGATSQPFFVLFGK